MKEGNRISSTSPIGVIPGIDDAEVGNDSAATPSQLLKKNAFVYTLEDLVNFPKDYPGMYSVFKDTSSPGGPWIENLDDFIQLANDLLS